MTRSLGAFADCFKAAIGFLLSTRTMAIGMPQVTAQSSKMRKQIYLWSVIAMSPRDASNLISFATIG
jgi:hypothetical protein